MTQQLLIPAYFYPGTNPTLWTMMNSAPAGSVIVANPASGPGGSSDPVYVSAIAAAQAAGMRVVGYVSTPPGFNLATIESQIDLYKLWYNVDGIFCDQVSGLVADETAYTNLAAYIRGAPGGLVVFNCGTPPLVYYVTLADITCVFENTYAQLTTTWELPSYQAANATKIAMIAHDTSSAQATAAVYQTIFYTSQYIYVTDGTGGNPYSSLGSYWSTLLSLVAAGASLGPVLEWSDDFESYTIGVATITAPWTSPGNTVISGTIYESGSKSLGVGHSGSASGVTRTFPAIGDLGPQWTVDCWLYMPSGTTVPDPPVSNSPGYYMKRSATGGYVQIMIGGMGTYYIGYDPANAGPSQFFTGTISLDTWHRFTWGLTMGRATGTSYLIVDGGALQTFGPAYTQTGSGDSVVDEFVGVGQLVVGSPAAEVYIDNLAIYRGAFTPSSGGGSKPFAHMLPAGLIEDAPIPGIGALSAGAALKAVRLFRNNPTIRRREMLRRLLTD